MNTNKNLYSKKLRKFLSAVYNYTCIVQTVNAINAFLNTPKMR
jgi:hypothetical protein